MLQGQLVNIVILLQWKYPILDKAQDQDITRRAGIPKIVIYFFPVENCLSTNQCKVCLFPEANSKITFLCGDSSRSTAVQYLQGSQSRLAVIHGISYLWESSKSGNVVGSSEPPWLIQGYLK